MASKLDHMMSKCPPPDACSEKELDDHSRGAISALHYSLKKGIELFGDKPEKADEVWNYHGDDKVGGNAMVERMSAGFSCRRGKCKRSG